jgi:hypothetical protein
MNDEGGLLKHMKEWADGVMGYASMSVGQLTDLGIILFCGLSIDL